MWLLHFAALFSVLIPTAFPMCMQQWTSTNAKVPFEGRVLVIGFGGVSKATVPMILDHIEVAPEKITIIDKNLQSSGPNYEALREKGVKFNEIEITPTNLNQVLASYLKEGDLLVDLGWNIDTAELLKWTDQHRVLYLNTSVEVWNPYHESATSAEKTLYHRYQNLPATKTTAVIESGANPGLISHFVKEGLRDIAGQILASPDHLGLAEDRVLEIKKAFFGSNDDAKLAHALRVKAIHCSERDTQISAVPKRPNEFVNTWSPEGFREEGTTVAELGWGTHEKRLPPRAGVHINGPQNQIFINQMGIHTLVQSYIPGQEIVGMVVRHGEAYSLSNYLTHRDTAGKVLSRPTVLYAYMPSDAAIASLHELRARNYKMQDEQRVMSDEITSGSDTLGALIMGDFPQRSWWTGTSLSIDEARRILPHQNATTIQVAIGIVSSLRWMINNPQRGLLTPEGVPHDFALAIAKPYLGTFISKAVGWTPTPRRSFEGFRDQSTWDEQDPWQFTNFLLEP